MCVALDARDLWFVCTFWQQTIIINYIYCFVSPVQFANAIYTCGFGDIYIHKYSLSSAAKQTIRHVSTIRQEQYIFFVHLCVSVFCFSLAVNKIDIYPWFSSETCPYHDGMTRHVICSWWTCKWRTLADLLVATTEVDSVVSACVTYNHWLAKRVTGKFGVARVTPNILALLGHWMLRA